MCKCNICSLKALKKKRRYNSSPYNNYKEIIFQYPIKNEKNMYKHWLTKNCEK